MLASCLYVREKYMGIKQCAVFLLWVATMLFITPLLDQAADNYIWAIAGLVVLNVFLFGLYLGDEYDIFTVTICKYGFILCFTVVLSLVMKTPVAWFNSLLTLSTFCFVGFVMKGYQVKRWI